jgi:hypothetical protein
VTNQLRNPPVQQARLSTPDVGVVRGQSSPSSPSVASTAGLAVDRYRKSGGGGERGTRDLVGSSKDTK